MSKGLGKIERETLAALRAAAGRLTAIGIACEIYRVERDADGIPVCNDAQHSAVRRALSTLKRKGLVDSGHRRWPDGRLLWCAHGAGHA